MSKKKFTIEARTHENKVYLNKYGDMGDIIIDDINYGLNKLLITECGVCMVVNELEHDYIYDLIHTDIDVFNQQKFIDSIQEWVDKQTAKSGAVKVGDMVKVGSKQKVAKLIWIEPQAVYPYTTLDKDFVAESWLGYTAISQPKYSMKVEEKQVSDDLKYLWITIEEI